MIVGSSGKFPEDSDFWLDPLLSQEEVVVEEVVVWSLVLDLVILGLVPGILAFSARDLFEERFDAIMEQYKTLKRVQSNTFKVNKLTIRGNPQVSCYLSSTFRWGNSKLETSRA